MSATPNNAAPGWENARTLTPAQVRDTRQADGHNALQGLLAFACIHQQAARRKGQIAESPPRFSREEELALDEILQLVAARAIAITGADGVAIALAKDRAIVCRACAGKITPDPGVRLDPSAGFSGACLRSGEVVRCDDSEDDPRVNPQACRTLGARSMIAVPLSAKRRVIGLLEAFSAETHGFNDSDVRSLNLLGELILAAIRPEEEHHLAEMAREVLPEARVTPPATAITPVTLAPAAPSPVPIAAVEAVPKPAAVTAALAAPVVAEPALPVPSKILVDEKFVPAASPRASVPAKPPVAEQAPADKKMEEVVPEAVHESVKPDAPEPAPVPLLMAVPMVDAERKVEPVFAEYPFPDLAPQEEKRSFLSIALTAVAVLVVIGMAALLIWKGQHLGQSISANTQPASQTQTADGQLHETVPAAPAPPLKIGATAQVLGIHHSSTADTSTVVVDLEDQVQYEAHSLDDPPRIYFDLHDTKLSPAVGNETINVDDTFLKRVRVAQPFDGITRVVLETKNQPDFSVSLDTDPYRLTIQVHKAGATPASSQPAIQPKPALPKPSPAVGASPSKPPASSETRVAAGDFEIVLDAGHGGWDLGTVGRKGLLEKDLVLDIVQRLGELLENRLGANVVYTRQDDSYVSLEKRAEIANLAHADLFLSVHANYSDLSTARGVETYYTNTYSSVKARTPDAPSLQQVNWGGVVDIRTKVKGARLLASDIQQALYGGLAARNPEIRDRGVKEAEYVVLTGTQMPAVLAEVSFVSSPADEDRLQSSEYRQLIAEALYKGVVKYREETQRTKAASLQKTSRPN
jgi:N-acetylmuramoyl-L-alanine amidase/putative methionine-R-sulfoxide reductase with GAF domain